MFYIYMKKIQHIKNTHTSDLEQDTFAVPFACLSFASVFQILVNLNHFKNFQIIKLYLD